MYHSEARRRPSQYRSLQVNTHTHYCSSSRDLRGCTVQHRHLVIFLGIFKVFLQYFWAGPGRPLPVPRAAPTARPGAREQPGLDADQLGYSHLQKKEA